jgi:hypothetical protein
VRERQNAIRQSQHEDDCSNDSPQHFQEVPERPHAVWQSSSKADAQAESESSSSSSICSPSALSCSSSPSSSSLGCADMQRPRSPKSLPPLTSTRLSAKSEGLSRDATLQELAA